MNKLCDQLSQQIVQAAKNGQLKSYLKDSISKSYCLSFRTVNYLSVLYEIDDFVRLGNPQHSLCKIKGIYSLKGQFPFLKVSLVARPNDIPLALGMRQCLGSKQIFETDIQDIIGVQLLSLKVQVYSFQDYEQAIQDNSLYTRASWIDQNFVPEFESWERICSCQKAVNPEMQYVQCDHCDKWYHLRCVGVGKQIQSQAFKCFNCKNKLTD